MKIYISQGSATKQLKPVWWYI